jgi:choline dehydrogenase
MSHDVIIVGSGAAGSVIARRLIDQTDSRVLLLEAGGEAENAAVHDPARSHELWHAEEDWDYLTVPQHSAGGRRWHLPRGKVIGGSTSTNGMIYIRGWHGDFDYWAYLGNAGWTYQDVLPLFKRGEDFDGGASEYRGADGPLRVISRYEPHPVAAALIEASVQWGMPHVPDHNGASLEGAGLAQFTISGGRRFSAADAFLTPVRESDRLEILTGTRATKLVFDGTRCTGVEVRRGGGGGVLIADAEVIVCAGTLESPKLLMLSGIGDPEQLERLGIDVRVALPGVGANLHDHTLTPLVFEAARPVPPALTGATQHQAHLFWHSRDGLPAPDLQPLMFNVPLYPEGITGPDNAFTFLPGLVRPASRGTLRLASADPEVPPVIDPGYLTAAADVDALVSAVSLCREIMAQPAIAEWTKREVFPGPAARTEAEIGRYVRDNAITYHHQVGTCKMGVDAMAVVDPELRVRGVEGLRVADASVMPAVTTGNTMAPTNMIGERAADLIAAAISPRPGAPPAGLVASRHGSESPRAFRGS